MVREANNKKKSAGIESIPKIDESGRKRKRERKKLKVKLNRKKNQRKAKVRKIKSRKKVQI